MFGAHLARPSALPDKLTTNQERLELICKTLNDKSIAPVDRFTAIDDVIVTVDEYRYVSEPGLRIETTLGDFSGVVSIGTGVAGVVAGKGGKIRLNNPGVDLAGVAILAGLGYWVLRSRGNYMAVFWTGLDAQCAHDRVRKAAANGKVYFPRGQVAVFQILSSSDYWNVSVLLNARTGLEFEDEAATVK